MARQHLRWGNWLNLNTTPDNSPVTTPQEAQLWPLSILLKAVRDEVNAQLDQSLHRYVRLSLGQPVQPGPAKRPWDVTLQIGHNPSILLSPHTPILSVFEQFDVAGRLLILGEPGSGKTTTLLELAQGLLDRADADPQAPIPVLFNLSSWQDPKQSIQDWLVVQLKQRYGVWADLGQEWVATQRLLPLLDGLDEVRPECQPMCIQALSAWFRSETLTLSVVVCCRPASALVGCNMENENKLVTQLELNGAIYLKALTDEQIATYLKDIQNLDLWWRMQADATLLELARSPLLLNIMILTYGELLAAELQQWARSVTTRMKWSFDANAWIRTTCNVSPSTEAQLHGLLDLYIQQMMTRSLESRAYRQKKPPNSLQSQRWLKYLAQELQQTSEAEFLIEQMQPSQLNAVQKWLYRIIVGPVMLGLGIGLVSMMMFGLLSGPLAGLFMGLVFGLVFGSFLGLIFGILERLGNCITSVNFIRIEISQIIKQDSFKKSIFLLISGIIIGAIIPFIGVFIVMDGLKRLITPIEVRIHPNQGIWNSAKNMVILTLILMILLPIGFYIQPLIDSDIPMVVCVALTVSIITSSGGGACIQHFCLRLVLFLSGAIPWNYARFLNYATERLFLQRIGGRYRFMHKLLQDYFAQLPTNP